MWVAGAPKPLRSTAVHLRAVELEIAGRIRHCRPVRELLSIVGFPMTETHTEYA